MQHGSLCALRGQSEHRQLPLRGPEWLFHRVQDVRRADTGRNQSLLDFFHRQCQQRVWHPELSCRRGVGQLPRLSLRDGSERPRSGDVSMRRRRVRAVSYLWRTLRRARVHQRSALWNHTGCAGRHAIRSWAAAGESGHHLAANLSGGDAGGNSRSYALG